MKTIDDSFSSLTRFFQKHKSIISIEPEFPYQRMTNQLGRVNARLHFFDGSYLSPHYQHTYHSGHRETEAHAKLNLPHVIQQIVDRFETT